MTICGHLALVSPFVFSPTILTHRVRPSLWIICFPFSVLREWSLPASTRLWILKSRRLLASASAKRKRSGEWLYPPLGHRAPKVPCRPSAPRIILPTSYHHSDDSRCSQQHFNLPSRSVGCPLLSWIFGLIRRRKYPLEPRLLQVFILRLLCAVLSVLVLAANKWRVLLDKGLSCSYGCVQTNTENIGAQRSLFFSSCMT